MPTLDTLVNYPLDITGQAATNLVTGEQHPVTEANYRDYFFIVPIYAPFYTKNFQMVHIALDGTQRILNEGEDYTFALPYLGATRSIGIPLYGAVTLNNTIQSGFVSVRYQTLGGEYIADQSVVLQTLAELVYNPRITVWDTVTTKQVVFPPINHSQQFDTVYGEQKLIDELSSLAETIAGRSGTVINIIADSSGNGTTIVDRGAMEIAIFPDHDLAGNGDVVNFKIITRSLTNQLFYVSAVFENDRASVLNLNSTYVATQSNGLNGIGSFSVTCKNANADGTRFYFIARSNNAMGPVVGVSSMVTVYDNVSTIVRSGEMILNNPSRNGMFFTNDIDTGISNPTPGQIAVVADGERRALFDSVANTNTFYFGISKRFVLVGTGFEIYDGETLIFRSSDIVTNSVMNSRFNTLTNGASTALDQLNEFSAAINNDPNFATHILQTIAGLQSDLGYTPVQQGTGIGQIASVPVKIGWSGSALKATAGSTDLGNIIFSSNLSSLASTFLKLDGSIPMNGKLDTVFYDSNSAKGDSTSSFAVNSNGGTGDAGLAAMTFNCKGFYSAKLHLRADGYFGLGGGSRDAWSWYSDPNGNMVAAGNVSAYSDPRLKDNFTKLTNSLEIIEKLNGYRFTWNEHSELVRGKWGKVDIGLRADEVKAVFPEIVTPSMRDDKNGEVYDTVAYDKLVPVLIEAIKQLSNQVKDLTAEVDKLKK